MGVGGGEDCAVAFIAYLGGQSWIHWMCCPIHPKIAPSLSELGGYVVGVVIKDVGSGIVRGELPLVTDKREKIATGVAHEHWQGFRRTHWQRA